MAETTNRTPLSTELIVDTAIELADSNGIGAVSMRRLGQALGVEAMSLYHYVPNKAQLLAAMTERVVTAMYVPQIGAPWRDEMRRAARSAYATLVAHSWSVGQLMHVTTEYPMSRFRWMNGLLGCLRSNGFSVELTHHCFHALDGHIIGFAYWATSLQVTPAEEEDMIHHAQRRMSEANLPWLLEHMQYHLDNDGEDEETTEFEFCLELILESIERLHQRAG